MINKNEDDKRKITVTIDRVKLTLEKYKNKKSIIAELFSYLGSILTLFITVCTAQYNNFWIFTSEMLKGIFIILLAIMCAIFFIRLIYLLFTRKGVYNEESFINSLEYKTNVKTNAEINNKRAALINLLIAIGFLVIVAAYVLFGFLAKWHIVYDFIVSIIALSLAIAYISNWADMFKYLYDKLKKKDEEDSKNG